MNNHANISKLDPELFDRLYLGDCALSERGEANSVAIARELVTRFAALPDDQQAVFFDRLSNDFSPDPKAVLQSAQAYANEPSAP